MASESELCVDKLLLMTNEIDSLCNELESGTTNELVNKSRCLLNETQAFVDNNKTSIPPYILKKVSDALKTLERHTNGPDKKKLSFKFNSKSSPVNTKPINGDQERVPNERPLSKSNIADETSTGFRDKNEEELCLGPRDIENKDVSVVNLKGCKVKIAGSASTVYVRGLKDSTVTICLASRAITVRECTNCTFEFVCQQLRIDSTSECSFSIFTSARSMLESSTGLKFSKLDLDKLASNLQLEREKISDFMRTVKFDKCQNNWNCIDDFDWLSPSVASKNFQLVNMTP